MARSTRPRTERRQAARDAVKDAKARLRLAALERGGAAERPIVVESASVIELRASSAPCAACGKGDVRVVEHTAERGLRRVHVRCHWCAVERDLWFQIVARLLS